MLTLAEIIIKQKPMLQLKCSIDKSGYQNLHKSGRRLEDEKEGHGCRVGRISSRKYKRGEGKHQDACLTSKKTHKNRTPNPTDKGVCGWNCYFFFFFFLHLKNSYKVDTMIDTYFTKLIYKLIKSLHLIYQKELLSY